MNDLPASDGIAARAEKVLAACREAGLRLVTAESCTGGLLGGALTEIPGSSEVYERGFITYTNEAKHELLGVPTDLIATHGAVSAEVAEAMASGALAHAHADIAIAVTGVAGPGGGTAAKPVGLVYIASARGALREVREFRFGDAGRGKVRALSVAAALDLILELFRF